MKPDKNNFLIRQRSIDAEKFELQAAVAFSNIFSKEEALQDQENIEKFLSHLEHHANRYIKSDNSHFSVPHNDVEWFRRKIKGSDEKKLVGKYSIYTFSNDIPIPFKEVMTWAHEQINFSTDTATFDPARLLKSDFDVYLLVPKDLTRSVVDFYTSVVLKRVGISLREIGLGGHIPRHILVPAAFVSPTFKIKVPLHNAFFMFIATPVNFHFIPLSGKFIIKQAEL